MTPEERRAALEVEFTRLKERADYLDRVLQGDPDTWVHITELLAGKTHVGVIELDKPVAEARQTALAMATVAKALDQLGRADPETPTADPLQKMEARKNGQDEVAQRRASKAG